MIKSLSVFFPCFNEEKNLSETVNKALKVLENLALEEYEVIIINDGSSDSTGKVADDLASKNPRIRVIHHPKNLGYGEALKSGFKMAKYDTVVYNDGDGQFDFLEVKKFLEKIDETDLIIGYRVKRADNPIRTLFAKGWAFSLWLFFGLKLRDVDCGFKMIKKEVLEKIGKLESTRGGMINAELVIKAKRYDFRLAQVGVSHYPRIAGKPSGATVPVIVKSYIDLLRLWWSFQDKLGLLLLTGILGVAAILRFYRIDEYMTFLGDEGRDALMIKRILETGDIPLIGPPTSIGNIYLGPLYYYMMSIPMAIFWLNPIVAAGMVALIGVLTVLLIYYLGKVWFGKWAGAASAILYAISPVTIIYSRSSWNPNPTPFFALLAILGVFEVHRSRNFRWLILTGAATAFAVQMHYLALILLPIVGLLWIYEVILILRKKIIGKHLLGGTIGAILIFLALMSPLVIFDLKHDFLNYKAISTFFLQRETTINLNPINTLERVIPIYSQNLIGRYLSGQNPWLTPVTSVLVIAPLVVTLWMKFKGLVLRFPYLVLGTWLFIGIFGLALYKQNIYDHYLGFLNPVPYLLLGALFSMTSTWNVSSKLRMLTHGMWLVLAVALVVVNLQNNPLKNPPGKQLQRTQDIARFVIMEAQEKPFNFALIAKNNYDSAYQFYLDIYGYKPKTVPAEITDQLFVVCEDPVCVPINHPKYEIAGFGMIKVEKEQVFLGVKVYKLIHNPSGRPQ